MIIKGTNTTTGSKVYQLDGMRLDFECDFRHKPLSDYMTDNKVDWRKLVDEKDALDAVMKGIKHAEGLLANPFENEAFMEIAVNTEHDLNRVYRELKEAFVETIFTCNKGGCVDVENALELWHYARVTAANDFDKLMELVREWLGR